MMFATVTKALLLAILSMATPSSLAQDDYQDYQDYANDYSNVTELPYSRLPRGIESMHFHDTRPDPNTSVTLRYNAQCTVEQPDFSLIHSSLHTAVIRLSLSADCTQLIRQFFVFYFPLFSFGMTEFDGSLHMLLWFGV
jgi:hypothetical protein